MWLPIVLWQSHKRGRGPARCPRRVEGLTLVELLLALTLFVVLIGAVAALVIAGTKVQLSWGRSIEPYERLARIMERLQRDMESAQPLYGIPFAVKDGGATLEFARVEPVLGTDGEPTTEWVKVTYRVAAVGDGKALMRDEALWKTGATDVWRSETLAQLASGQFAVAQVDATGALTWTTSWNEPAPQMPAVPRLIKIDCVLPTAQEGHPVSLSRAFRNPAGALLVQSP